MKPGPKPKPYQAAVREGRTSHKPIVEGMVLPPSDLVQPDWDDLLPGRDKDAVRVRERCSQLWGQLADVLSLSAGLVRAQQFMLQDYCVTVARIEQAERHISRMGAVVQGERGAQRNPWLTLLNQYRGHLRTLTGELGLSPASASRIPGRADDTERDPFGWDELGLEA